MKPARHRFCFQVFVQYFTVMTGDYSSYICYLTSQFDPYCPSLTVPSGPVADIVPVLIQTSEPTCKGFPVELPRHEPNVLIFRWNMATVMNDNKTMFVCRGCCPVLPRVTKKNVFSFFSEIRKCKIFTGRRVLNMMREILPSTGIPCSSGILRQKRGGLGVRWNLRTRRDRPKTLAEFSFRSTFIWVFGPHIKTHD